jgi:hypothetical protein
MENKWLLFGGKYVPSELLERSTDPREIWDAILNCGHYEHSCIDIDCDTCWLESNDTFEEFMEKRANVLGVAHKTMKSVTFRRYTGLHGEHVDFDLGKEGSLKALIKIGEEEKVMNKNIAKVYEKTQDALLVEKHLSHEIPNTFLGLLLLRQNKTEILLEAERREAEEKAQSDR